MLRYNTFRSARYLRSRFVEGRYLLASEATDLQLETIDLFREFIKRDLGNVAIEDGWQVFYSTATEAQVNYGEAWFEGLPFIARAGLDQLVSKTGGYVEAGTLPTGVTITESGGGKNLLFTSGSTPANTYAVVVTAKEQLVTSAEDPFLKNANLTESTSQKIRLVYQINVVPNSGLNNAPVPYTNDVADQNLVNYVEVSTTVVTPYTVTSGSEGIDGRNLEIKVDNPVGSNPLPTASADQATFAHGKLIDSLGQKFHLVSLYTNPEDSDQVILRIDKEVGQSNPDLTSFFKVVKRDVYATPSDSEFPQGKLFWKIAEIEWDGNAFPSQTASIVDSRTSVPRMSNLVQLLNQKQDLVLTGGGNINWDLSTETLTFSDVFTIINPAYDGGGVIDYSLVPVPLLEGGSLVFDIYLDDFSFNTWGSGYFGATLDTGGTTITTLNPGEFQNAVLGCVIQDSAGNIASFLTVDDQNGTATVSAPLVVGPAAIYPNSFAAGASPKGLSKFVLASRLNNKIYFHNGALELEDGETNQIGDGTSQQTLDFIGASSETDNSPAYSSNNYVTSGNSLTDSIGDLDAEAAAQDLRIDALEASVLDPVYDEVLNYPSGLVALTNVTIPFNSRKLPPAQQTYTLGAGTLCVYVNGIYRKEGVDWQSVNSQTITFLYDLTSDTQVHFRIDSVQK